MPARVESAGRAYARMFTNRRGVRSDQSPSRTHEIPSVGPRNPPTRAADRGSDSRARDKMPNRPKEDEVRLPL